MRWNVGQLFEVELTFGEHVWAAGLRPQPPFELLDTGHSPTSAPFLIERVICAQSGHPSGAPTDRSHQRVS